jgi:hypothetical protein
VLPALKIAMRLGFLYITLGTLTRCRRTGIYGFDELFYWKTRPVRTSLGARSPSALRGAMLDARLKRK